MTTINQLFYNSNVNSLSDGVKYKAVGKICDFPPRGNILDTDADARSVCGSYNLVVVFNVIGWTEIFCKVLNLRVHKLVSYFVKCKRIWLRWRKVDRLLEHRTKINKIRRLDRDAKECCINSLNSEQTAQSWAVAWTRTFFAVDVK